MKRPAAAAARTIQPMKRPAAAQSDAGAESPADDLDNHTMKRPAVCNSMRRPAAAAASEAESEIPAEGVESLAVASEGGPPDDGDTPMRRPASSDAVVEGLNCLFLHHSLAILLVFLPCFSGSFLRRKSTREQRLPIQSHRDVRVQAQ